MDRKWWTIQVHTGGPLRWWCSGGVDMVVVVDRVVVVVVVVVVVDSMGAQGVVLPLPTTGS